MKKPRERLPRGWFEGPRQMGRITQLGNKLLVLMIMPQGFSPDTEVYGAAALELYTDRGSRLQDVFESHAHAVICERGSYARCKALADAYRAAWLKSRGKSGPAACDCEDIAEPKPKSSRRAKPKSLRRAA